MCVSMAPAVFTGTKIYVGLIKRPDVTDESSVPDARVLMYQNEAMSMGGMPNAMLLHIPTDTEMSQANFIDMSNAAKVLDDMAEVLTPRTRSVMLGADSISAKGMVQVFESGMFHIVLADNAEDIPSVLNEVPIEKRPHVNPELLAFYQKNFPTGYKFVLACFNSREFFKADPIALWYIPSEETKDYVVYPALDCHTGNAPDIYENVPIDHFLFFSNLYAPMGTRVRYSRNVPSEVAPFLPEEITGKEFTGRMLNGDFRFLLSTMRNGIFPQVERHFPGVVSMNG